MNDNLLLFGGVAISFIIGLFLGLNCIDIEVQEIQDGCVYYANKIYCEIDLVKEVE